MIRRAVLYARISVATEESVSVARQLDSGRKYASARGWKVVGEFVDEGVSATRNKPSERGAWQELLGAEAQFEAVVVWKVDRLARRVIDFLQVDEVLQARGAALVCVEQSIDMTTGEGRAFAQMLAVFGEMEAAAISSRRRAAREYLILNGRAAGGRQPYGWRLVPHPDGAGKVRAQDPERIDWVRGMVERAMRGDTIYSITQWLDAEDAPKPKGSVTVKWQYGTVTTILRNPVLVGMTAFNPGNSAGGLRGPEVLRDADGKPVLADDAIMSMEEFEQLQAALAARTHPAAIPRSQRRSTSPVLAGIATCSNCGVLLNRFRSGRPDTALRCRRCGQTIAYPTLTQYVIERMLRERGGLTMYRRTWIIPGDEKASRRLADLDRQLAAVATALTLDNANTGALTKELTRLKRERTTLKRRAGRGSAEVLADIGRTLAEIWALCSTDEQRRELLSGQIERLVITKAQKHSGRVMDPARIHLEWRPSSMKTIAPDGISLNAVHSQVWDPAPWVSIAFASAFVGCPERVIKRAVKEGFITRRDIARCLPGLSRSSVERFAETWRAENGV